MVSAEGLVGPPVNLQAAVEEIGLHQGAAAVGGEAADFAVRHLAGGQAGDHTIGKAQGGIDVIDRTIGAAAAGGGKANNGGLRQFQHQIDVMDHEIQHHRDVIGAVRVGAVAAGLQHHDLLASHHLDQLAEGRVKALDVPHLQQTAGGFRRSNQIGGLVLGGCDRLLDQDVDARVKAGHADAVVQERRHRDANRFDFLQQLGVIPKPAAAKLLDRKLTAMGVWISNPDKLRILEQAEHPGVVPAHVSDSDDPNADWLHGVGVPAQ